MNVVEVEQSVSAVVVVSPPKGTLEVNSPNVSLVLETQNVTLDVTKQIPSVVSTTEQGPMGPPGVGDKSYDQTFTNSSFVTVIHNLGKYPAVTVVDSAGDECEGVIDHLSINELTVAFSAPFSGTIFCN